MSQGRTGRLGSGRGRLGSRRAEGSRSHAGWWRVSLVFAASLVLLVVLSAPALAATISGTVTDVNGGIWNTVSVDAYDASGTWVASADTASNGSYTIVGLPAGDYRVATWNDKGYIDEWYDNVWYQPDPSGAGATLLTVSGDRANIDFVLVQGLSISGTVTAVAGGAGIENVQLFATDASGNQISANTDASGNYTIPGLPPGDYRVATSNSSGYVDEWYDNVIYQADPLGAGATLVTLTTSSRTGIDFALAQGFDISGTVTNAAGGAGIDGVSVDAVDALGSHVAFATTNPSGSYTLVGLPPGDYRVVTSNSLGFVDEWYNNVIYYTDPLGAGANIVALTTTNRTGIDFALAQGRSITGTVTDASGGAVVEGVSVDAYDASANYVVSATTNASGVYTITGLAPGNYLVATSNTLGYLDEWWDNVPYFGNPGGTGATLVNLTSGNATGINFALTGGRYLKTVTVGWNLLAGGPGSDILGETAFGYDGAAYVSVSGANWWQARDTGSSSPHRAP